MHDELEHAIHLFCSTAASLITPFHNMMLVCPATDRGRASIACSMRLRDCLGELYR